MDTSRQGHGPGEEGSCGQLHLFNFLMIKPEVLYQYDIKVEPFFFFSFLLMAILVFLLFLFPCLGKVVYKLYLHHSSVDQ